MCRNVHINNSIFFSFLKILKAVFGKGCLFSIRALHLKNVYYALNYYNLCLEFVESTTSNEKDDSAKLKRKKSSQ